MVDFPNENVLNDAVMSFIECVDLKVKQFRRYVPKKKTLTNPVLTGTYIEEVVRGFVCDWIGHQQLVTGTFYSKKEAGQKPLQLDGIVYDPTKGPTILRERTFAVVHPAFCSGVIEIKMTYKYIKKKEATEDYPGLMKLEQRLENIHERYLSHLPSCHVMAIVIADDAPDLVCVSPYRDVEGRPVAYHAFDTVPLRPIFVLFSHDNGEFQPQRDAIENMIRAIYHLRVCTTYI